MKSPKKRLTIYYHGTDRVNAESILIKGFNKGTYFAKHLEDAIEFGGRFVFSVVFEDSKIPKNNWQFITPKKVPTSKITSLKHYSSIRLLKYNDKLIDKVFKSNLNP